MGSESARRRAEEWFSTFDAESGKASLDLEP
jgi:hypothetical protein